MEHLDRLEATSIHIIRESYANFKNLGMLWSIGKDSTVLQDIVRNTPGVYDVPAVFADTGLTLLTILNSLRIIKKFK